MTDLETKLLDGSGNGISRASTTTSWKASDLEAWRALMQETHDSGINIPYKWRIKQLTAMERLVTENRELIVEALYKDLGKERTEAIATEVEQVLGEIKYFKRHLKKLMKLEFVASPGVFAPSFTWIEKRPLLGPAVLILGPSNYPLTLCCKPAVGSLTAGNPTFIKPSELCPAVAQVLATLVPKYFAPSECRVVLGGVEQVKLLLSYSWGKVLFTGSPKVGRLVAEQTARTLTPTVLELGGKTPCYIDGESCSSFDWILVANRIIFGKLLNTGQTCAAVDYLVVPQDKLDVILSSLQDALDKQFGSDPYKGELGRIVQAKPHAQRHVEMIRELENIAAAQASSSKTNGNQKPPCKIVTGGSALCRPEERYICPTFVVNPPLDSRAMTEEIFGPILPILTVNTRKEAVDLLHKVESVAGTPLCLYVFTNSNKVFSEITHACRAGSALRNDCVVHLVNSQIPFGGLGGSGIGAYHGPFSFNSFSQSLPCMYRPLLPGADMNALRAHPFGTGFKQQVILTGMKIPYVPVILPRSAAFKLTVGILGVGLVIAKAFPESTGFWLQPALSFLANGLEYIAAILRGGKEEPN